jgi:2-polyprenyl-3-methyl-5-hydroxy-6-metoxy-1,4-benzoquinol methylase
MPLPMGRRYLNVAAKFNRAWWIMKSEALGAARNEEKVLTTAPPHVEILSPAEAINFPDQWYEIMDEHHFWMIWRTRAFLQQCRALSISTEIPYSVLEIGCGHGILRHMLEASTRWKIDAVDLNADALFHSTPGRGRTALYNIHDRAPDLAAKYDAIVLFDVIEHIENPTEFMSSALYHLKPGGYVFINVPALQSLYSKFDVAVGHYRRYSKQTLEADLAKAGVRTMDDRYWGMTMLPLLVLRKLLLSLSTYNTGKGTTVVKRGVMPPGRFADAVLTAVMRLETSTIANAPIGTSLLYVGQAG